MFPIIGSRFGPGGRFHRCLKKIIHEEVTITATMNSCVISWDKTRAIMVLCKAMDEGMAKGDGAVAWSFGRRLVNLIEALSPLPFEGPM